MNALTVLHLLVWAAWLDIAVLTLGAPFLLYLLWKKVNAKAE